MSRKRKPVDAQAAGRFGRNYCRVRLRELLPAWQHVWIPHGPDGGRLMRGDQLVAWLNWAELRAKMAPEHYDLFCTLYVHLVEQANIASLAVPIANVELGISDKRATPRKPNAAKAELIRAKAAELAEKKLDPYTRIPWIAKAARCSQRYVRDILSEGRKTKKRK